MTDSFATELRDLIDRAFVGEHGGRASAQMVHNSAHRDLPEHLIDFLVGKGLASQVAAYFREKDGEGLPKRPAVNGEGEHVQLALLTVEECGYVYAAYCDRATANEQQAEKVRQFCLEQHGVDLASQVGAA